MHILAGTAKGLFVFEKRGADFILRDTHFEGQMVYAAGAAGGRLWAAPFTEWTGTNLVFSEDNGATWTPVAEPLRFPEHTGAALAKIWQIREAPGGRLLCGVEPSALFISEDGGASWDLCEGLWNHPHREQWHPGYGGLCLHTILPLSGNVWIAGISTGGVYRTEDAGKTWSAANQKIVAPFMPGDGIPEFGQCVHKIAFHPSNPDLLMLQHHWGVYRSTDAGRSWHNVGANKLPSDFGFACVMNKADQAFLIPIKADEFRCFPEGRMRVYRTRDAGETWEPLGAGLPQKDVYDCVLRDSFDAAGEVLAFGTTGGNLYCSGDDGDSWKEITGYLPRISCVRVVN